MSELWDIAKPFTGLTAREIAYGNKTEYAVFSAVVLKLGHPITKEGCLICVDESLQGLRKAYKQYLIMENSKKGVSSVKIKGNRDIMFEGGRYNSDNLTDEVALRMLEKHPEYEKFLIVPDSLETPESKPAEKPKKQPKAKKAAPKKSPPKEKIIYESN